MMKMGAVRRVGKKVGHVALNVLSENKVSTSLGLPKVPRSSRKIVIRGKVAIQAYKNRKVQIHGKWYGIAKKLVRHFAALSRVKGAKISFSVQGGTIVELLNVNVEVKEVRPSIIQRISSTMKRNEVYKRNEKVNVFQTVMNNLMGQASNSFSKKMRMPLRDNKQISPMLFVQAIVRSGFVTTSGGKNKSISLAGGKRRRRPQNTAEALLL